MTTITNLSIYTIIYKLMLVIFKQIYVNYIYIFVLYINRYECIQYAKLCKLNLLLHLLIHSKSYQLLYKKKKLFHEVHSCCESEMHWETFKSLQENILINNNTFLSHKMAHAMRAIPLQLKPNLPYLPHTSQTYYGNFIPQLAYSTFTLKFFDNNRLCVSFPHSYLLIVTVKKRKFTATLPNSYIGPYNIF